MITVADPPKTLTKKMVAVVSAQNMQVVDFVNAMTIDSYAEQLERTKLTSNQDLEFYGAVFYGETAAVSEITKKFSLFR